jgi:hypothetical protein
MLKLPPFILCILYIHVSIFLSSVARTHRGVAVNRPVASSYQ